MEHFFPSEIARLVLGYLQEVGCFQSWNTFLKESQDLREYFNLYQEGKIYSTNVNGKSLLGILNEYCVFKKKAEKVKTGLPKKKRKISESEEYITISDDDGVLDEAVKSTVEQMQENSNFSPISTNRDVDSDFTAESSTSRNETDNECEKESFGVNEIVADKVCHESLINVPNREIHESITDTNTDHAVNFNCENTFDNARNDVISNTEILSNSNSEDNSNRSEISLCVQETVNSSNVGIEINPAADDLFKTCDNLTENSAEDLCAIDGMTSDKPGDLNYIKNNMDTEVSKEVKSNNFTENNIEMDKVEASKEVKSNNDTENNMEMGEVEASKDVKSNNDIEKNIEIDLLAEASKEIISKNISEPDNTVTLKASQSTTVASIQNVPTQIDNQASSVPPPTTIVTSQLSNQPSVILEMPIPTNNGFLLPSITPDGIMQSNQFIVITPNGMCMPLPTIASGNMSPIIINTLPPTPLSNRKILPAGADYTGSDAKSRASSQKNLKDSKSKTVEKSETNDKKKPETKDKKKKINPQDSGSANQHRKNKPRHPKRKLRCLFPDSPSEISLETPAKNPDDDIPGMTSALKLFSQITGQIENDENPHLSSTYARCLDFNLKSNDESEANEFKPKKKAGQLRRSPRLLCSKEEAKDAAEALNSNSNQQQMKKSVKSSKTTSVSIDNKKLNSSTTKESLGNLNSSVFSRTLDICSIREEDMQIFEDGQNTDLDKSNTEEMNSTSEIARKNVLLSNQTTPTQNIKEAHENIEGIMLSGDKKDSCENLPELPSYLPNKSATISPCDKFSLLPEKSSMKSSKKNRKKSKKRTPQVTEKRIDIDKPVSGINDVQTESAPEQIPAIETLDKRTENCKKSISPCIISQISSFPEVTDSQTMSVSEQDSDLKSVRKNSKTSFPEVSNSQPVSLEEQSLSMTSTENSKNASEISNSENVLHLEQDSISKVTKKITDNGKNSISETNNAHIVSEQVTCIKSPEKNIENEDEPVSEVSDAQIVSAVEQIPAMKTLEKNTENKKSVSQCSNSQTLSALEHNVSKKSTVKKTDIKTTVNSVCNDVSKQTSPECKSIESVVSDNLPISDVSLMTPKVPESGTEKKPEFDGINQENLKTGENPETISRYKKQNTRSSSFVSFCSDSEEDSIPDSVTKLSKKKYSTNTRTNNFISKCNVTKKPLMKTTSYDAGVNSVHSEMGLSTSESDSLNLTVSSLMKDASQTVVLSPQNCSLDASADEVLNNPEMNEEKDKTTSSSNETKSSSVDNSKDKQTIGDSMRTKKLIVVLENIDDKLERTCLEDIISCSKDKENEKLQLLSETSHNSSDSSNEFDSFRDKNIKKDTPNSIDHQPESKISSPNKNSSRTAYKTKSANQYTTVKEFDVKENNVNKVLASPKQTTNIQKRTVISPRTIVNPLTQKDKSTLYQQTFKPIKATSKPIIVKESSLKSLKCNNENSENSSPPLNKTKSPHSLDIDINRVTVGSKPQTASAYSTSFNTNNNCNGETVMSFEKDRQSLNQDISSNFTIKETSKENNKIVSPKNKVHIIPVDLSFSENVGSFMQHYPNPIIKDVTSINSDKTASSIETKVTETPEVPISKTLSKCTNENPVLEVNGLNSEFISHTTNDLSAFPVSVSPLKKCTVFEFKKPDPKSLPQSIYWKSGRPKTKADFYKDAFPSKKLPISPSSVYDNRKLTDEEMNSVKSEGHNALNIKETRGLNKDLSKENDNAEKQKNCRKSTKPINKENAVKEIYDQPGNEFQNKCSEIKGNELTLSNNTCEVTTVKENKDLSCGTGKKRKRTDFRRSDTCENVSDCEVVIPVKNDDWLKKDMLCKKVTPVKEKKRKINCIYSSSDESPESSPENGRKSRSAHDFSKLSPNTFPLEASLQSPNANTEPMESVNAENACVQKLGINYNAVESRLQNNILEKEETNYEPGLKKTTEKNSQISTAVKVPTKHDFSKSMKVSKKSKSTQKGRNMGPDSESLLTTDKEKIRPPEKGAKINSCDQSAFDMTTAVLDSMEKARQLAICANNTNLKPTNNGNMNSIGASFMNSLISNQTKGLLSHSVKKNTISEINNKDKSNTASYINTKKLIKKKLSELQNERRMEMEKNKYKSKCSNKDKTSKDCVTSNSPDAHTAGKSFHSIDSQSNSDAKSKTVPYINTKKLIKKKLSELQNERKMEMEKNKYESNFSNKDKTSNDSITSNSPNTFNTAGKSFHSIDSQSNSDTDKSNKLLDSAKIGSKNPMLNNFIRAGKQMSLNSYFVPHNRNARDKTSASIEMVNDDKQNTQQKSFLEIQDGICSSSTFDQDHGSSGIKQSSVPYVKLIQLSPDYISDMIKSKSDSHIEKTIANQSNECHQTLSEAVSDEKIANAPELPYVTTLDVNSKPLTNVVIGDYENTRDMVESDIGRSDDEGSELAKAIASCRRELLNSSFAHYSESPDKSSFVQENAATASCEKVLLNSSPIHCLQSPEEITLVQETKKDKVVNIPATEEERLREVIRRIKEYGIDYVLNKLKDN